MGEPRAAPEEQLQDAPSDKDSAMAAYLHSVFTGVAARAPMHRRDHLIYQKVSVEDSAEHLPVAFRLIQPRASAEYSGSHRHRAGTA